MDSVFIGCAALGGVLFFVQMILQFVGHDTDAGTGHDISGTADASFKLLSFQGLTAFFMMFGLVGLAMTRQFHISTAGAVGIAVVAGGLAMLVIGKIFTSMRGLQSTGTLDLKNAIGQPGDVYLTIPAGGTGQVQVKVQNHLRIFDASSKNGEELKTGTQIRVVALAGARALVVERS
jgi:membrane protein implicated in regulation of membrane protease activity